MTDCLPALPLAMPCYALPRLVLPCLTLLNTALRTERGLGIPFITPSFTTSLGAPRGDGSAKLSYSRIFFPSALNPDTIVRVPAQERKGNIFGDAA